MPQADNLAPSLGKMLREGLELPGVLFNFAMPVRTTQRCAAGQPVVVIPGLMANRARTSLLRRSLAGAGFTVFDWGCGANMGMREGLLEAIADRVRQVSTETGQPVVLLGWSLGGIYAREVARIVPHLVRMVVTVFSPFSGDPRANNAWRVYELVGGQKIDELISRFDLGAKPPVPTLAFWSAVDGVVAPAAARGGEDQSDVRVELHTTHFGFGHNRDAIRAVARQISDSLLTNPA